MLLRGNLNGLQCAESWHVSLIKVLLFYSLLSFDMVLHVEIVLHVTLLSIWEGIGQLLVVHRKSLKWLLTSILIADLLDDLVPIWAHTLPHECFVAGLASRCPLN